MNWLAMPPGPFGAARQRSSSDDRQERARPNRRPRRAPRPPRRPAPPRPAEEHPHARARRRQHVRPGVRQGRSSDRNLDENHVTAWGEPDMNGTMGVTSDAQRRFETLYDAHRLEVLADCARRVRAAQAGDACAETFLVAWRRMDAVPPPPKTLPYLYGIAARVIANQRRTLHRRSRLHHRLSALGVTPPADPCLLYVQGERTTASSPPSAGSSRRTERS